MFTSAQQVAHLLRDRRRGRPTEALLQAFRSRVVDRLDRADDDRGPGRSGPEPRHHSGAPEDGPPRRGRRRRLAGHGQGRADRPPRRSGTLPGSKSARERRGQPTRRTASREPVPPRLPSRADRHDAHLADATGRPLHGRIPRRPREGAVPPALQGPRPGRRGHGHGRRAAGRRCGDPLRRHPPDPGAAGPPARIQQGRGSADP